MSPRPIAASMPLASLISFSCAQLRDSLTAKDSPVVSQEDNDGGVPLPQRAETNLTPASFWQQNVRELCTHRSCHSPIIWDKWLVPLIPKEPSGGPSCAGTPFSHLLLVPTPKLSRHQLAGETETAGRGLRRESTRR